MTRVGDSERNETRNKSRFPNSQPNTPKFAESDDRPTFFDVSDEELERASGVCDEGVPTLIGTYCFTCPTTYVPTPINCIS
jgi:hypothetical protein